MKQVDYFYAVATCNYLSGRSLNTIEKILADKGKPLNAGFVVRMPGTYIPVYGANSERTQERKFRQKTKKAESISLNVKDKRSGKIEKSTIGIDWLLAPAMAKKMDRFEEFDRDFIAEDECSGCGTCAKVCPFSNIAMENGKPQWQHNCRQCYACIHLCPKGCIQIGNKTKGKKRYRNPNVPLDEIIRIAAHKY
jgi:ferredoxin